MGKKWIFWGAASLLLLLFPFLIRGYWVRLLTNMFMFGILAESVNVIAGFCGYLALGNMLFFGLGAYIVAVLMVKLALPFALALAIAGLGSALFSVLVGLPILRLKGQYFLMGTFGLLELLREIMNNLSVTGGGQGISLPIFPGGAEFGNFFFYYLMLFLMLLAVASTLYISRSHFGYAFRAIKFDEDAAAVVGVNPTPYKTFAWAISAFFTGLAGGVYVYWMSYINPGEAFQVAPSIKMYLMMVLGGAGTVWGPIAGAFFIEFISEIVWANFLELHFFLLGIILILSVIFMPKGFMDFVGERFSFSRFVSVLKQNRV